MKFTLRNKTILLIALTTVGALLFAGIMINLQVNSAFNDFVNEQIRFLQSEGILMQSVQRINTLRRQIAHMTLEAQFQRQLWQGIAAAGLVSLVMAIGVGIFFANRLTSPLKSLQLQIEKMKAHQYHDPVVLQGDPEITSLAESFEQLRRELIKVEELRKDLLSDMAHEMTTPLQTMLGIVEGIEEGIYKSRDKLPQLKKEITTITALVDDLRQFSHARAKTRTLDPQTVELKPFLEQTIGPFADAARQKQLSLELSVDAGLSIRTDPALLQHMIANLVKNAIQYTETGIVTVRAKRNGSATLIEVSDTGIGIDGKDLPYIFERFFRSDRSRSRASGGTGLGLAIVKEYAERLRWSIKVVSQPDHGSTFSLSIPDTAA